jgi:non-canonical purine NTP pyrophosphatase, rdgB/HAM1 family
MMQNVTLASSNAGKIREFEGLLTPLGWRVTGQDQLGIVGAEEPHRTFLENALSKARHVARVAGTAALADDSGLCVSALQGAPGVDSAHFSGPERDDQRNNMALLQALAGQDRREAYYYCVLVWLNHADDPTPWVAEGRWYGEIGQCCVGNGGFGYDPLFRPKGLDKTAAQLTMVEKNRMSHRALAWQQLVARIQG